jgi:hypothetical protein
MGQLDMCKSELKEKARLVDTMDDEKEIMRR